MNDEFQDPLQDYSPKKYDDPVEQALAEDPVTAIDHQPFATISPDLTVEEAIAKLAMMHVACLLVVENNQLLGVFTDRDALDKIALELDDDVANRPIRDFMTTNPVYVYETDASASALAVMSVSGHRHVPILDLDGNLTGIVSPQRVTEYLDQKMALSN